MYSLHQNISIGSQQHRQPGLFVAKSGGIGTYHSASAPPANVAAKANLLTPKSDGFTNPTGQYNTSSYHMNNVYGDLNGALQLRQVMSLAQQQQQQQQQHHQHQHRQQGLSRRKKKSNARAAASKRRRSLARLQRAISTRAQRATSSAFASTSTLAPGNAFCLPGEPQPAIVMNAAARHGAPLKKELFKTSLCRHFQNGFCSRGSKCNFAHGVEELRAAPRKGEERQHVLMHTSPWAFRGEGEESPKGISAGDAYNLGSLLGKLQTPSLAPVQKTSLSSTQMPLSGNGRAFSFGEGSLGLSQSSASATPASHPLSTAASSDLPPLTNPPPQTNMEKSQSLLGNGVPDAVAKAVTLTTQLPREPTNVIFMKEKTRPREE